MDAATILSKLMTGQNLFRLLALFNLNGYLWPDSADVQDGATFDFIIVGGGTAGCIVASNLAKHNVSVLLIEAGGQPGLENDLPGLFPFLRNSRFDWNFTSIQDDSSSSHRVNLPEIQQGKVLGGTSQVNYMLYGIGNPVDYEEWATLTNDNSWKFKELCPLFKRSEKLTDKVILNSPDRFFHGTQGNVEIKKYHEEINHPYFESYHELGYKVVRDINPKNRFGYTNAYFNIGCRNRQSTAHAFISPEKDNPYLHVMMNSEVVLIIFDEHKKAVGVKILTKDNEYITVYAEKEIVVTAGTIKSPQILMLSGIGPKEHLESKNIEVLSDLPVGENFHDHATCILIYGMDKAEHADLPSIYEFPVAVMDGYVAVNRSQKRADYQVLSGIITDPKFFLAVCGYVFSFTDSLCDYLFEYLSGKTVHFVTHHLLYTESRGIILLNNTDPKTQPIISPRYYSVEKDLENHAKFVQHYNAIVNTTFYRSVNAEPVHPDLQNCVGLERDTSQYWKCYVKGMASTLHNYVGTCAMGSVVDSKLRVKGVKNLRVADASVMPKIVGSTIQATVMMIAQRASDLLIEQHKL